MMISFKLQLLKLIDRRFIVCMTALYLFDGFARSARNPIGVVNFSDVQYVLGITGIISTYLVNRYFSDKAVKPNG